MRYMVAIIAILMGFGLAMVAHANGHRAGLHIQTTCQYRQNGQLPDPVCTPGATNPAVTQGDIHSTICVRGWTATIRPSYYITEPEKIKSMAQYGVTGAGNYEYDHLIPLEVGGAPNDFHNMWPQPHSNSFIKDSIENKIKAEVCAGKLTLVQAQHIFTTDWRKGK